MLLCYRHIKYSKVKVKSDLRLCGKNIFPLECGRMLMLGGSVGVSMENNARPRRSYLVDDCLESHGVHRIDSSARSPILNPIENSDSLWETSATVMIAYQRDSSTPTFPV
ncbi:hypothetical protein AVEN_254070-1 [Araneus ventricosus]|uniref:Uncharacterized protein n=1 Tax=Araneus ventricosus TaxID=182803 RepID=A0A4Y2BZU6_ARAVE|nr:hypothetical protein AVEN_254070-1 [Araneus ventricosus]